MLGSEELVYTVQKNLNVFFVLFVCNLREKVFINYSNLISETNNSHLRLNIFLKRNSVLTSWLDFKCQLMNGTRFEQSG